MKTLKTIGIIVKWIIILFILLFSIVTLVGKAFGQTIIFWLIAATLAFWPAYFADKWNKNIAMLIRVGFIVLLIAIKQIVFKSDPKSSIYISDELQQELMKIYDEKVTNWPENAEEIYIETNFGLVHVLACGKKENPPLMMIHAASMGAHSWAENLEPVIDSFRIYSVDNIGEGNKSQLKDALVFPNSQQEIADHLALIADSLGISKSPVFGASNGGYIAQCYTANYPERVSSLALFGPMGITQLTGKSIMMLSIASMYPFQFIRDKVTTWGIGDDEYVVDKYGDWFNCILKGTIPSVAMPVPMTAAQKKSMEMPVLLFLGTKDQIVGDAEIARQTAQEYPDIHIEILESGHLISVEHANYVNQKIKEFLYK